MQALIFNHSQAQATLLANRCHSYELSTCCFNELPTDNFALFDEPNRESKILLIDQSCLQHNATLIKTLISKLPQHTFAVTCEGASVNYTVQLMNAGVAWVFADWSDLTIVDAGFRSLLKTNHKLGEQYAEHRRLQSIKKTISIREWQVIEMVLQGMPNKQIAKYLDVSLRTVEARRSQVYHKCRVTTPQELVRCLDLAARLESKFAVPAPTPVRLPHQAVAQQHLRTSNITSLA